VDRDRRRDQRVLANLLDVDHDALGEVLDREPVDDVLPVGVKYLVADLGHGSSSGVVGQLDEYPL
jgi:hypothetical protein